MDKIRFMVVSGFLGAGKTTTMIALAEYMDANWGKTALIANDLGANLVDTHLTQMSGCTVAEIASGCICYQMDNTIDQIRRLRDKEGARFVMSDIPGCGIGALDHVYRRLASENAEEFTLAPFMVIVDPERLRMITAEQADINLPDELVYLLKTQMEEGDLIVLNKIDTLSDEERYRYLAFLRQASDVPVMAISAREGTGIPELATYLTSNETMLRDFALNQSASDYYDAEAVLTWYNRRIFLKTKDDSKIDMNEVVDDLIEGIRMGLIEKKRNVPHLKVYGTSGNGDFVKGSLIGVDYDVEYEQELYRLHRNLRLIVNARATCESRPLARLMDDALDDVCDEYGLDCQVFFTECFGMADEGR